MEVVDMTTVEIDTNPWNIIAVIVHGTDPVEVSAQWNTVERYVYGSATFMLGTAQGDARDTTRLFVLVEANHTPATIDRLWSGLFPARHASPEEYDALGF